MPITSATLTADLARRGVTPAMLGVVVHRRTIVQRIQDGGAVEDIVRLLREAGHLREPRAR